MHHPFAGQAGPAATSGHQSGLRPGWLLDRPVGPDLRGGPAVPGPQAHVKRQQKHRRAQSEGLFIFTQHLLLFQSLIFQFHNHKTVAVPRLL